MIATTKTPARIHSPASPRPIEVMTMELMLLVWPRWKGEVHKMRNGSLTLPTVWILHTEQFSLCILIQRPKLLPLLVLRFAALLVPGSRARPRVAAAAPAPPLSAVAEEELGLRGGGAALARGCDGFGCRGDRLCRDGWYLTRHDAPLGWGWCSAPVCSEAEADFSCLAKGCRALYEELAVRWRVSGDNVPRRKERDDCRLLRWSHDGRQLPPS